MGISASVGWPLDNGHNGFAATSRQYLLMPWGYSQNQHSTHKYHTINGKNYLKNEKKEEIIATFKPAFAWEKHNQ